MKLSKKKSIVKKILNNFNTKKFCLSFYILKNNINVNYLNEIRKDFFIKSNNKICFLKKNIFIKMCHNNFNILNKDFNIYNIKDIDNILYFYILLDDIKNVYDCLTLIKKYNFNLLFIHRIDKNNKLFHRDEKLSYLLLKTPILLFNNIFLFRSIFLKFIYFLLRNIKLFLFLLKKSKE